MKHYYVYNSLIGKFRAISRRGVSVQINTCYTFLVYPLEFVIPPLNSKSHFKLYHLSWATCADSYTNIEMIFTGSSMTIFTGVLESPVWKAKKWCIFTGVNLRTTSVNQFTLAASLHESPLKIISRNYKLTTKIAITVFNPMKALYKAAP